LKNAIFESHRDSQEQSEIRTRKGRVTCKYSAESFPAKYKVQNQWQNIVIVLESTFKIDSSVAERHDTRRIVSHVRKRETL